MGEFYQMLEKYYKNYYGTPFFLFCIGCGVVTEFHKIYESASNNILDVPSRNNFEQG